MMNENKYYTGIDRMRLIAAVLVIMIYTSPLADYSAAGDFILTRIAARVAVPFFFMTTGYFMLSRYHYDNRKLSAFLKKTALIYAAAVILYLPINIYNGYFAKDGLLPAILRDIFFDGTMYHLWYLPASIIGMLIAWRLVQKLDYPKGLAVAALLYVTGLFGDSYYGVAQKIPGINNMYDLMFELFDYTRNGLFFAPVFMMMGGFIAEKKHRPGLACSGAGFAVCFILMTSEALFLHKNGLMRHDSMYVFLLPCTVFLFCFVLNFRGKKVRLLRVTSLLVYLLHPLMIVAVRVAVKLFKIQNPLVHNSLINFALVCITSVLAGLVPAIFWERRALKKPHCKETERAYIELDLANLSHNAKVLQAEMPKGCELMAVVKTEAYGHGAYAVSTHLERDGVKAFAVATIDEGIRLRRYGIRGNILILGFTDVHRAAELKKYHLIQTLIDAGYAASLNGQGITVRVHIGIDSGMHRLGFACDDHESVRDVFGMKNLKVDGIFTHLCCCESLEPEDVDFTGKQIRRFYALIDYLKEKGVSVPKIHIQSSYGLLNYPKLQCSYVREGISLYGVKSSPQDKTILNPSLRPVLSLKARIVLIRNVPKGDFIGYDRAYRAERDSRIAILPIGYGDGVPRILSAQKTVVRVGAYFVPIIGRICMDQLTIDITDTEGIKVGDTVTLIDNRENSLCQAPYAAGQSGSISNELLSRMGARLPVVVTGNFM